MPYLIEVTQTKAIEESKKTDTFEECFTLTTNGHFWIIIVRVGSEGDQREINSNAPAQLL